MSARMYCGRYGPVTIADASPEDLRGIASNLERRAEELSQELDEAREALREACDWLEKQRIGPAFTTIAEFRRRGGL